MATLRKGPGGARQESVTKGNIAVEGGLTEEVSQPGSSQERSPFDV